MASIEDLWPLSRLVLRIGDLELRYPGDADLAELAELAREPIHHPGTMPFSTPWTDQPPEDRARSLLQWHWGLRAGWAPDDWRLELVAVRRGEVVGTQGLHGARFALRREVESGSWVGGRFQGQGIGTAMRQAVLRLAFAGLGAHAARSGAFADNPASLAVSRNLGYAEDGTETEVRRHEPATLIRLLLPRAVWEARSRTWPRVTVAGLEGCAAMFGLTAADLGRP
ncbi:MAG TPA: GNAT family protein [Acidimicrobiales bacterium]|nr:GNAT family protein [Acidimicrobiales bacterium]